MRLYKVYVLSLIEYGSAAFMAISKMNFAKLQRVQNIAIRICLNLPRYIRVELEYAGIDTIIDRLSRTNKLLKSMAVNNEHHLGMLPRSPLDVLVHLYTGLLGTVLFT